MIFLVFPQAQNCVRFSQVFNVDNDPQTLIRQQAPNSELSACSVVTPLQTVDASCSLTSVLALPKVLER